MRLVLICKDQLLYVDDFEEKIIIFKIGYAVVIVNILNHFMFCVGTCRACMLFSLERMIHGRPG